MDAAILSSLEDGDQNEDGNGDGDRNFHFASQNRKHTGFLPQGGGGAPLGILPPRDFCPPKFGPKTIEKLA